MEVVQEFFEFVGSRREGTEGLPGGGDVMFNGRDGGDFAVEVIVRDLEGHAEQAGESASGSSGVGVGVCEEESGRSGEFEERNRLELDDAPAESFTIVAHNAEVQVLAFAETGNVQHSKEFGLEANEIR
jgi:hypothetical protein